MNWLKTPVDQDSFGKRVLAAGLDPQVSGRSVFDALEDLDAEDCIAELRKLNKSE